MVLSMTGFGKATGTFEGKKIVVEIRSLNRKSLDLSLRTIPNYKEKELEIRTLFANKLERGKVEVNISLENTGESKNYTINKSLAQAYYQDIKETAELVGEPTTDLFQYLFRIPEIYSNSKEDLSDDEVTLLYQLINEACDQLTNFRKKEGEELRKDFEQNIQAIDSLLLEIPKYENERIDIVRERMRAGLEKISQQKIDENRFEQELIFYIEKMDVSEEKMRLKNHLDYFTETLDSLASGKKLGFITQEIGREINTLGSKSYHVEMQKIVVQMKDYLEKIKEQVLNTL
jgi:uncharacterized protein (TIGR00255 family)